MEYTKLGTTDITISRLCAGCMSFGDSNTNFHSWTLNKEESENFGEACTRFRN